MLVILGILAVLGLGGVIYLFLSPGSSRIQKLAALGGLILSGVTLLVCGAFIILSNPGEETDPYAFPPALEEAPPQPREQNNVIELSVFLVVLLAFFGFVVFLGVREQKKKAQKKPVQEKKEAVISKVIDDKDKDKDDLDFTFEEGP